MKKLIAPLLLVVLLSSGSSAFAGNDARWRYRDASGWRSRISYCCDDRSSAPGRWSVRFGAGMSSPFTLDMFLCGPSASETGLGLSGYYGDYHGPTRSSGVYSIGGEYLLARWFAVAADVSVEALWHDLYDGITDMKTGRSTGVAVSAVAQAKFLYANRPAFRLYGYLGLGFVSYSGFDALETVYRDDYGNVRFGGDTFRLAGQFVPIGVEFGRRFFGFAEAGLGSMFCGFRAGFGYRF